MIRKDIEDTLIYKELKAEHENYFSYVYKKYLPGIDNIYYSAFIGNDVVNVEDDENINAFVTALTSRFDSLQVGVDEYYFINHDYDLLLKRGRFSIYNFRLSIHDFCDIFFAKSIPNINTPRCVVQIRSKALWLNDYHDVLNYTYEVLNEILAEFKLKIVKVQENRIDYCWHTNQIQNPTKYFSDDVIANNLCTQFSIYNKVGRKNGNTLTVEYLSLGQRKSNNLFFRTYNKTREVVEMGYKDFFLELWYQNKLISYYDKFCLEWCYKKGSYSSIEWAMLDFYLMYGKNVFIKKQIDLLKRDYNTNLEHVRQFIKKYNLCPKVTTVINVEFQTMRKFYSYSDEFLEALPVQITLKYNCFNRLFNILDNRKLFLDYLTSNTVKFVKNNKDKELMDWWKRLRSAKLPKVDSELIRDYSRHLNIDKLTDRLKGTLASMSIYLGKEDTDLSEDISSAINIINDNTDLSEEYLFVSSSTGQIKSVNCKGYENIKERKKRALQSIVPVLSNNN